MIFYCHFRFRKKKKKGFPRLSFAYASVMNILGMHKPHQQATSAEKMQATRDVLLLSLSQSPKKNPKSRHFYLSLLAIVSVRMVSRYRAQLDCIFRPIFKTKRIAFVRGRRTRFKDNKTCIFGTFWCAFFWAIFDYKTGKMLTC